MPTEICQKNSATIRCSNVDLATFRVSRSHLVSVDCLPPWLPLSNVRNAYINILDQRADSVVDPLYGGGAPSAVWCWLISGFGCMCIAVRSFAYQHVVFKLHCVLIKRIVFRGGTRIRVSHFWRAVGDLNAVHAQVRSWAYVHRYYTVSHVAPEAWVPSISWITGWLNVLGQIAGLASSEFGAAELLLAAVSIGTGKWQCHAQCVSKSRLLETAGLSQDLW